MYGASSNISPRRTSLLLRRLTTLTMKMKNKRRLGKAAERNCRDITGTTDRMRRHQKFRQQVVFEVKYNWKPAASCLGKRDCYTDNMSYGYQSRISLLPKAKREHETKRNLIEGTFHSSHLQGGKKSQLPDKVTTRREKKELTFSGTKAALTRRRISVFPVGHPQLDGTVPLQTTLSNFCEL